MNILWPGNISNTELGSITDPVETKLQILQQRNELVRPYSKNAKHHNLKEILEKKAPYPMFHQCETPSPPGPVSTLFYSNFHPFCSTFDYSWNWYANK